MRSIQKSWVVTVVLVAACACASMAQSECETTYQRLLDNRKGPELAKYKTALTSANDYLAKCGDLKDQDEVKEYVKKQVPRLAETVEMMELIESFNSSVQAKKWDETMTSGKKLLARNHPASLDIMIVLASVGGSGDQSAKKFVAESVTFAEQALKKLESGGTSENYGAFHLSYKTKTCPDGKLNTISWMNYFIGAYKQAEPKQHKEALPYFYRAMQQGCELRDSPDIYRVIGSWFTNEAVRLTKEGDEKVKLAGGQETEETKAGLLLLKGYLDRAIDAYARAVSAATIKNLAAEKKEAYNKTLQNLYESRFDGKRDGLDKIVAEAMNKPFADPTTPVVPAKPEPTPSATPVPPAKRPSQ